MEHNHNPLIYGFLLSFFMFGTGLAMGFLSTSGADLHSKLTLLTVSILLIAGGTYILRGTFKKRDQCPICKEKFHYSRKKP